MLVKKVFAWNSLELEHMLIQRDLLYKSLGKNDLLSVDDLPRSVKIRDNHVPPVLLILETKIATLTAGDPFLRSIVRSNKEHAFSIHGRINCCCITTYNFFYLFYSHSRDMHS